MNYRHAYHAGNFADVHKHVALMAILLHLRRKETPFCVVDTHAGRGVYDLSAPEALRTGEAAEGIGRLTGHVPNSSLLAQYLKIIGEFAPRQYPGSPAISAMLLRSQDRLVALEKHSEEFVSLRNSTGGFTNVHLVAGDGYERLPGLLPPRERRGLILVDPPYEQVDELARVTEAIDLAYRRFANGIYIVWHPLKSVASVEALGLELKTRGVKNLLSLRFDIGGAEGDGDGRLTASGLLVANPPHHFDTEMEAVQAELVALLGRGPTASAGIAWVTGDP